MGRFKEDVMSKAPTTTSGTNSSSLQVFFPVRLRFALQFLLRCVWLLRRDVEMLRVTLERFRQVQ